jgi:ubiquinone/menaquinone biosynthesis C-methylase UbiE
MRKTPPRDAEFIGGNYFDKYRSTNPIHQWLMRGFLGSVRELLGSIEYGSVLEVGCGPGDLATRILPPQVDYLGIDVDEMEIETARNRYPQLSFQVGSANALPVESNSFDLVIACEVLEHLEDPARALAEIDRVAKQWVLVSVPWEPTWRILNVIRGKYWRSFGNTPGHVQHFSRAEIRRQIVNRFVIVNELDPLPWTIIVASKRSSQKTHL